MIAQTEIEILRLIDEGGAYLIVLVAVWALLTKRLIPGWAYKDLEKRAERYEELALSGTRLARESVTTLKEAVKDETP